MDFQIYPFSIFGFKCNIKINRDLKLGNYQLNKNKKARLTIR